MRLRILMHGKQGGFLNFPALLFFLSKWENRLEHRLARLLVNPQRIIAGYLKKVIM